MGYERGEPDLMILNPTHFGVKRYIGMGIEFKSPKNGGNVSKEQNEKHRKYRQDGYKILVSNDYDECIIQINKYVELIGIRCDYCIKNPKFFRNKETLG